MASVTRRRDTNASRYSDLELRRDLDAHVGRLHHRVDDDSGGQIQLVGGFARNERNETMRTRLYLDLGHDLVLHHLRHDPDETITCRLRSRLVSSGIARDFDCEPGQVRSVVVAAPIGRNGGLDASRTCPTSQRVHADAEELGGLTHAILRHIPRLTSAVRRFVNASIHNGRMGKTFDGVDDTLSHWLVDQPLFCVATAPLDAGGSVNCSPKGNRQEFAVITPTRVAYLDQTGSGVETIAHLRENGRIVLVFFATVGPPRIVRLHGRGSVVERDAPTFSEFAQYFPAADGVGVRSIIVVDLERVSDSCGYGVPLLSFEEHRPTMDQWSRRKGPDGIRDYWKEKNLTSIDGIEGLVLD